MPWDTPAALAGRLIPVLADAPAGTTLNLNVPNVALADLRGLRHGAAVAGGTIRSAVHDTGDGRAHPHVALPPEPSGTAAPGPDRPGHGPLVEPDTDAGLVARGYASLTPLVGVREAGATRPTDTLRRALDALYAVPGVGPGPAPDDAGRRPSRPPPGRQKSQVRALDAVAPDAGPDGPRRPPPPPGRCLRRRAQALGWLATRTIGWWSPCGSSGGCRPGPDRPAPVDHRDRLVGDRRVRAPVGELLPPDRDPP